MANENPSGRRAALVVAAVAVVIAAFASFAYAMHRDRDEGRPRVGNGCDAPPSLR